MKNKILHHVIMISRYVFFLIFIQCVFLTMLFARESNAQIKRVTEVKIKLNLEEVRIRDAFKAIEERTDFNFVFSKNEVPDDIFVTIKGKNKSVGDILLEISKEGKLHFKQTNNNISVKKLKPEQQTKDKIEVVIQPITIKGQVISNEEKVGLPGVNVVVKGTTQGTVTDVNGNYTLEVPSLESVLVFSSVGYVNEEVVVGNRSILDITLVPDITSLQEIVVVGYGTQKKGDVTSSVASVKESEFVKGNVVDAGQLIQGKVAGLSVSVPSGDPTGSSQILLRGNTTILGANANPLILIDGIPGDMRTVAPEDIQSVDVLKDGSAAAIYGTRGTNGVILITTKRASGDYTNRVEYSSNFSTQTIARQLDMLTAEDYRSQISAGSRDASWDLGSSTDWMEAITETPFSQIHNLTFRGGNNQTNYLANVNYRDMEGILIGSDNQTFTGRVDVNHNMFDNKVKLNLGFLNRSNRSNTFNPGDQNIIGDGTSFNGYTYRQALLRNPTAPIKDAEGDWHEETGIFNYENPLSRIRESDGEHRSQNTRLNGTINYTPIEGLNLMALFSVNNYNQTRGYSESKRHISTLRDGRNGFVSNGTQESRDRLVELTAGYSKGFGKHDFSLLGGYSYQDNFYRNYWMQNWDFPTDIFSYHNIGQGNAIREGLAPISGLTTETNLIGFFGRLTYNFNDKYLLLASLRHEGASQLLGTEKPWGTFPAVSAGWRISREPFMEDLEFLTDLKLRAGYGVTGTQNIEPGNLYRAVALLSYGDYYYNNGQWIRTLSPSQNQNPYLKWEEKHETNFGLDFSIFNDRVSGNIDYYVRQINDLLYDFNVPSPPNLFGRTRANVGKMENKGLEVLLNIVAIETPDFVWNTSFNFSTNSNKLISLSNDLYQTSNDFFTAGVTGEPIQTHTHMITVGGPIGDFHGFKVVDIDESGKWIYETAEGGRVGYEDFDHSFDNKHVLGNGLPNYYAGWNNNVRYKNLDLSITMRGAFDYQILNFQRMYFENPTLQQYNQLRSSQDLVFGKAQLDAPLEFNSYYVENGDFWKIDNITLGYNIPRIGKYIQAARLHISTLNTFIFTGYKGIDPEVERLGLAPGNDNRDKYPTTRTFSIGVNLSL